MSTPGVASDKDYSISEFKIMARKENIRIYRDITGLQSVPENRQYWTLCNKQPCLPGSEICQLIEAGLITKEQFVGVDSDRDIIRQNKIYHPKAKWYAGDWNEVIVNCPTFNPGLVYLDTTSFADGIHAVKMTVGTMLLCPQGTVLLVNVMLNDPRSRKRFSMDKLIRSIELEIPASQLARWDHMVKNFRYNMTGYTYMGTYIFHKIG